MTYNTEQTVIKNKLTKKILPNEKVFLNKRISYIAIGLKTKINVAIIKYSGSCKYLLYY